MPALREVLAGRIRESRKKLKLTQEELASAAGFTAHQIVSEIERGGRDVKAWELARIAQVLKTEVQYLLEARDPVPCSVIWRDCPDRSGSEQEAAFLQKCRQYSEVEKLAGVEPSRQLPSIPIDPILATFHDSKEAARFVGRVMNLGSRPSSSLVAILEEDFGLKIWYDDLGEEGSAVSAVGADVGCAILMNRQHAPWRRNFSFAHELFHLITRNSISQDEVSNDPELEEKVEKLAQDFAASLLLPADALEDAFSSQGDDTSITYGQLVGLARNFDVSTTALVWRLVNCKQIRFDEAARILSDPAFHEIDRSTMSARWRDPSPLPERYVRLAFHAFKAGRLSRTRLAELLDTSLFDLPDVLMEYGFKESDEHELKAAVA